MFRKEGLPAPFGPIIEVMPPRRTEIDTSSTARTPPKRFDTPAAASRTPSCASVGPVAPRAMPLALLPKTMTAHCSAVMAAMMLAQPRECNTLRPRLADVSGLGLASPHLPHRTTRETIRTMADGSCGD